MQVYRNSELLEVSKSQDGRFFNTGTHKYRSESASLHSLDRGDPFLFQLTTYPPLRMQARSYSNLVQFLSSGLCQCYHPTPSGVCGCTTSQVNCLYNNEPDLDEAVKKITENHVYISVVTSDKRTLASFYFFILCSLLNHSSLYLMLFYCEIFIATGMHAGRC